MATVNKSSLRAEFDALKARFESLCVAGTMSADSRALFDALLMLFEVLMAVFMEKHTPKSSANSSLPASQSPNDETARTRPGAKGKGPSHNGERCANTRTFGSLPRNASSSIFPKTDARRFEISTAVSNSAPCSTRCSRTCSPICCVRVPM